MKYRLIIIITIFFLSCGQESPHLSSKEKVRFHKVVYLDAYYSNFLKEAKTDYSNRDKIYVRNIRDGMIKDHFSGSEYSDLVAGSFSYPIQDTNGLEKTISALNRNREQVESIISSALERCNQYLKNDSITFYIAPSTADLRDIITKMGGVTGETAGSKQIILTIDFNVNSWKEMLAYSVAHEYNHAYWTNANLTDTYKWTLLRYLVFEGKADSFAHLLYPNVKAPWTSSLDSQEKTDLWNRIKGKLQSETPALLGEVMFGSQDYPVWGGYTLGFDIMQTAFKNHPELLKTNWTDRDADKLLEMSDYKVMQE